MIWSAARNAHPALGVGSPSREQNPLSLNLLTSLGSGAFITVSQPVERRLNVFPVQLVVCLSLALPPLPLLRVVPRKKASSVRAWVMCVFSSARGQVKVIAQKGFDFLFDFFGKGMAAAHSHEPVIGISQVSNANVARVGHLP
jgi:hypothetical protein